MTAAEWKKYNGAITSGVDAGLRISKNAMLVECENGDYSYKLVIYDDTFEDKPIKAVYAIGANAQPTTNSSFDEKVIAEYVVELEEMNYDNKRVLKGVLESYSANVKRVLGRYSIRSHRFIEYRRKVSQSGRNTQNQSDRAGVFGGNKGTVTQYQYTGFDDFGMLEGEYEDDEFDSEALDRFTEDYTRLESLRALVKATKPKKSSVIAAANIICKNTAFRQQRRKRSLSLALSRIMSQSIRAHPLPMYSKHRRILRRGCTISAKICRSMNIHKIQENRQKTGRFCI